MSIDPNPSRPNPFYPSDKYLRFLDTFGDKQSSRLENFAIASYEVVSNLNTETNWDQNNSVLFTDEHKVPYVTMAESYSQSIITSKASIGSYLALFFNIGEELDTKNLIRGYENKRVFKYVAIDGIEHLYKYLECSFEQLEKLLHVSGAPEHPFSKAAWQNHPRDVWDNMILYTSFPANP